MEPPSWESSSIRRNSRICPHGVAGVTLQMTPVFFQASGDRTEHAVAIAQLLTPGLASVVGHWDIWWHGCAAQRCIWIRSRTTAARRTSQKLKGWSAGYGSLPCPSSTRHCHLNVHYMPGSLLNTTRIHDSLEKLATEFFVVAARQAARSVRSDCVGIRLSSVRCWAAHTWKSKASVIH